MPRLSRAHWRGLVLCLTVLLASAMAPASARAPKARPAPVPITRDAAIVVDGASGRILYSRNADSSRRPASLTKMMTLYLLFGELDEGNITLDAKLTASRHSASQQPTKLGLGPGQEIDVETAIKAVTVLSANDVAVMIAERIGKTESAFAALMTAKARELGMMNTSFHNASGLPDDKQLTTARDMALLGRHLAYDFPQYYSYFSTPSFAFDGRTYDQHDHLLGQFAGTDGIKTGYTRASGFNLVTSAVRDNKHIVGVVMGGMTYASRDAEMVRLLSAAFDFAAQNPTVLADANAPWQGGKGPVSDPFNTRPDGASAMIASLNLDPVPAKPPKIARPARARTVVASLKPPPRIDVVMPIPKPVLLASAEAPKPGLPYTLNPIIPYRPVSNPVRTAIVPFSLTAAMNASPGPVLASTTPSASTPRIVQSDLAGLSLAFAALKSGNPPAAKRWSVQIGAFPNETLAEEKLAAYAKAASSAVGQSERIVAPFTAFDGRTLYRARFAPFAEDQARDICSGMIRRGQSCFATAQTN